MSRPSKQCARCGTVFYRTNKHTHARWAGAKFCSRECCGKSNTTHGMEGTRLYRVWQSLKQRCLYQKHKSYNRYGGRGVSICQQWRDDFAAFATNVGPDPGRGFQLGRIDNNRGYEPGNVRWESPKQNTRNRRTTRWIELGGEQMSLAEACEKTGINYHVAWHRLKSGWTIKEALNVAA